MSQVAEASNTPHPDIHAHRLLIVDCISSLGAMEFDMDRWQVDAAITASQKGLMTPTGISFVAINQRGWAAVEKATKPGYYVNFKNIKKFFFPPYKKKKNFFFSLHLLFK